MDSGPSKLVSRCSKKFGAFIQSNFSEEPEANWSFEGERRDDSLREIEECFKPWKSELFVRGLEKVLLGSAEAPTEASTICF